MREYMGLFRGKEKRKNNWVKGALLSFYQHEFSGLNGRVFIMEIHDYISKPILTEVDPETVGECTGLKDKNGKLIFEGDVVKSVFTQRPYLVCFGEFPYEDEYGTELSGCGFYNKDTLDCVTDFGSPEEWAIVIGNIHDNPGLMEGAGENATD